MENSSKFTVEQSVNLVALFIQNDFKIEIGSEASIRFYKEYTSFSAEITIFPDYTFKLKLSNENNHLRYVNNDSELKSFDDNYINFIKDKIHYASYVL